MKTVLMLGFIFVVGLISVAAVSSRPTVQAVSGVNFATSATVSGEFPVPDSKMVSVVIYKTGAGVGHAYLQGSNDGTGSGWKDINATTYPGASGAFTAGSVAIMLNAEAVPWSRVRFYLKETGTNSGVITGGKWTSK